MALRSKIAFAARIAAALLLVSVITLVWAQSQGPAQAESSPRSNSPSFYVRVLDGETIEDLRSAVVYRLANVDAARAGSGAACAAEAAIGDRGAAMARALIARARSFELRPTGAVDDFGHPTAYVAADGRDLGEALVDQGFGRPARDDGRPWCDPNGDLIL
jgi:endonuclease YncB( thermonuclease family)